MLIDFIESQTKLLWNLKRQNLRSASQEYMVRPPMPPAYFFVIDVSAQAVASGSVQVVTETIKACLDKLPGESRTQVNPAQAERLGPSDSHPSFSQDVCYMIDWRSPPV